MNTNTKPLEGQLDDVAEELKILVRDFEKQKLDLTVRQMQSIGSSKEKIFNSVSGLAKSLQGLYKFSE